MVEGDPDRSGSGLAALVEVLELRRRARIGFGAGILLATAVFVLFVVLPEATRDLPLYLTLGGVLALSLGMLFTAILVLVPVVRFIRHPETLPVPEDHD
ncbi:MAG: hypothetical protein ABEJ57_02440 [Halobacteriaceae archaeon]